MGLPDTPAVQHGEEYCHYRPRADEQIDNRGVDLGCQAIRDPNGSQPILSLDIKLSKIV